MYCLFWLIYCVFSGLNVVFCRTLINERDVLPVGCEWQIQLYEDSEIIENPVLVCHLRTIRSIDDLLSNLTVLQTKKVTSLKLECSDVLFFESSLEPNKYRSGFLSSLRDLKYLHIDYCKLRNVPAAVFTPLRKLRSLTLQSHNSDWSAMILELHSDSFRGLAELRYLDLANNNIWTVPSDLFCPLFTLQVLNLTRNKLHDLIGLSFSDWVNGRTDHGRVCNIGLETLDLSYNNIIVLPDNGLSGLRSLKALHLQENEITAVSDRAFAGLIELRTLNISSNRLVALPPELFQSAKLLHHLYLQNNSLSVLAPGLLEGLDQLQILDLSKNKLSSRWINRETFSGLTRLVVLDLAFNSLTRIDVNLLQDLYSLKILHLHHNNINYIAEHAFSTLKNLHVLALSCNNLARIESHHLSGTHVLHQLLLDGNRIEYIHPRTFENLTNLQDLSLNDNRLIMIPIGLGKLRFLKTLDLGKNQIDKVNNASFEGLDSLYGLRLVDNKIVNISRDAFSTLPSLQVLNLASNKIRFVEQSAFSTNPTLKAIRLDSNELTDMSGVFTNLQSLVWLNISSNRLIWFDFSHLPLNLEWLDIHDNKIPELSNYYDVRSMLRIKMLDVSFNLIEEIQENSIPDSVETLYLNNNRIKHVKVGSFLNKNHLEKVVLYGNQIKYLNLGALALNRVSPNRDLPQFYIGGNPFYCDCTMEWLLRVNSLTNLRQYPQILDLDVVTCTLPHTRGNPQQFVFDLKPSQFLCQYDVHCFSLCHCCDFDACDCEMTCPDNCTCYHDHTWTSNVVDCSNSGFINVPHKIPMDATEIYLDGNNLGELGSHLFIGKKKLEILFLNNSNIIGIHNRSFIGAKALRVLHMDNNNLVELRGFEFDQLEKLEELYLDNNKITYVANNTFKDMQRLRILSLNNNEIIDFSPWNQLMPSSDTGLFPKVILNGNKWSCDCASITKLVSWMQENITKIICLNTNDITVSQMIQQCDNSDNAIATSVIQRDVIFNNPLFEGSYVPLLAGTLVFIIVVCLFAAIVFVFRHDVQLWAHSKYGISIFKNSNTSHNDEDAISRLYDCYMVYSQKDQDLVTRFVTPELEQSGFSVGLLYRDLHLLPAASYLADAMVGASESCRRVILIISQEFVSKEWSNPEFRTAVHTSLRSTHKYKFVCVIFGDNVSMDHELKTLIRECTVARWGEKRFWEKLKYALPNVPYIRQSRHSITKSVREIRCKSAEHHFASPEYATDAWYRINDMSIVRLSTPTPTQLAYTSVESTRCTEDEADSSTTSDNQQYDADQSNHSYMSIENITHDHPVSCPPYKESYHVYSTITDTKNVTRTYFV